MNIYKSLTRCIRGNDQDYWIYVGEQAVQNHNALAFSDFTLFSKPSSLWGVRSSASKAVDFRNVNKRWPLPCLTIAAVETYYGEPLTTNANFVTADLNLKKQKQPEIVAISWSKVVVYDSTLRCFTSQDPLVVFE